jgi:hypothetical protein
MSISSIRKCLLYMKTFLPCWNTCRNLAEVTTRYSTTSSAQAALRVALVPSMGVDDGIV